MTGTSTGYTVGQIVLHWTVACLILVQMLTSDAMEDFFDGWDRGRAVEDGAMPLAVVHIASGATVLVLALLRLRLRARNGAPPPPEDLPAPMRLAARVDHIALYALIIALPLTGAAGLLLAPDAADLHSALVPVLWVVAGLHVAAALFHGLVRRDGVFSSMLRPGGARGGLPPG